MKQRKMPLFWSDDRGGWVKPLPELAPGLLGEYLPERLRDDPRATGFLAATRDSAETIAQMVEGRQSETTDTVRDQIQGIEAAARRMQAALKPLEAASEAFEWLQADAHYLLLRTREVNMPTEGRPVVPPLHTDATDLAHMLQRMHDDLGALRVLCDHTAGKVQPQRSTPKHYERQLVSAIADHYRHHFGELPPKRSWFADEFMVYVGECVGLTIGHRIVGEVIASKS